MFFTYGKQFIDDLDILNVKRALKKEYITQGELVKKFENNLSKKFNAKYTVAVSSGSAALHLSALALGWGKNDTIITTPITFAATANAVEHVGAAVDFVDIDEDYYTLDSNKLEDKLKKTKKKIKAVIAVDYAGNPCDWEGLYYLSKKYSFQLLNDNCHAIGSKYKKITDYLTKFSLIATHSYHPVKNITTGEGGSVLTDDYHLYKKILILRSHGIVKNRHPWKYNFNEIGFNYRLTDFQSALGISQLKKLDKFLENKKKIANLYFKKFSNYEFIKLPKIRNNCEHSFHLFPLLIDFKKIKISKLNFFNKMRKLNINLQVHYIPLHYQKYYKKKYNFKKGTFPVAENFYEQEVSLPIYSSLSINNAEKISNLLLKNLGKI
jgi:dTDP-4-amino-4,6-dideoxygalactose transaminase